MFSSLRIVLVLVLLAGAGGAYLYVNNLQKNLEVAKANSAKLESAVSQNEQTIEALRQDYAKVAQELNTVNQEFANIRAQNQVLADKLAKHDLAVLGSNKPGLVGNIINRASEKAGRCFEILSGAQLTDNEKEAKDGNAFNSECPWLWPGTPAN